MKVEQPNNPPEQTEPINLEGEKNTEGKLPPLSDFTIDDWQKLFKQNPKRPK